MELFKKPRLLEKFRSFHKYVSANNGHIGTHQRGIDLNLSNACNLKCEYCFTNAPKGDHAKDILPTDVVRRVANEADELGIFEFDLQGGELLMRKDRCDSSRTFLSLSHYEWLLLGRSHCSEAGEIWSESRLCECG
jgi:cyclic pyranopterin phosphate synthase